MLAVLKVIEQSSPTTLAASPRAGARYPATGQNAAARLRYPVDRSNGWRRGLRGLSLLEDRQYGSFHTCARGISHAIDGPARGDR